MARRYTKTCPTCLKLNKETTQRPTNAGRWGYARIPVQGSPSPKGMKRLYIRGESVSYQAIGHICDQGHVVLDRATEGPQHLVTPTIPHDVICLATGETVPVPL